MPTSINLKQMYRLVGGDEEEASLPVTPKLQAHPGVSKRKSALGLLLFYTLPAMLLGIAVGSALYRDRSPVVASDDLNPDKDEKPSPVFGFDDFYNPRYNRFLTEEQCDVTFPALDREFVRASEYWQTRGGISEQIVEDSQEATLHWPESPEKSYKGMRVVIINNRLFIRWVPTGPSDRMQSILQMLNEAIITSTERLPDVDFVFDEYDIAEAVGCPVLSLCRKPEQEELWTMPDFGFGTWPRSVHASFETISDRAAEVDAKLKWSDKIGKLYFRGAFWVGWIRQHFADVAQGHEWSDVQEVNWDTGDKVVTMDEHCKWKFLAHCEGTVYSARFKYLSQCRSVIVSHPPSYIQHFSHLLDSDPLSDKQNIVMTAGKEWQGLDQVMEKLLADDVYAERVANQSHQFFRHWLSPASTNCAWRSLIRHWARAQTFEPRLKSEDVDFATYNVVRKLKWAVH